MKPLPRRQVPANVVKVKDTMEPGAFYGFDSEGRLVYYENVLDGWYEREYDESGNLVKYTGHLNGRSWT